MLFCHLQIILRIIYVILRRICPGGLTLRRCVPDGPERFRDAYRHVVDLFRENGADNVTWVFHIASVPGEAWNAASCYYPGDAWVDWIGASVYGRLRGDAPAKPFDDIMKKVYPGLAALSEKKPVAVLEMGVSEAHPPGDKADWMREALSSIASGRYPSKIGRASCRERV